LLVFYLYQGLHQRSLHLSYPSFSQTQLISNTIALNQTVRKPTFNEGVELRVRSSIFPLLDS